MIKSVRHKALANFHFNGKAKGLNANHLRRIRLFLDHLEVVGSPGEMGFPGSGLHVLAVDRKGQYS